MSLEPSQVGYLQATAPLAQQVDADIESKEVCSPSNCGGGWCCHAAADDEQAKLQAQLASLAEEVSTIQALLADQDSQVSSTRIV
jgi:hypothetical protein